MKNYKRLSVGAQLGNTPTGVLVANLVDFDGGEFELSPKLFGQDGQGGIVLVDPSRPASYGFQIQGDADALNGLARALQAAARSAGGNDEDSSTDAE